MAEILFWNNKKLINWVSRKMNYNNSKIVKFWLLHMWFGFLTFSVELMWTLVWLKSSEMYWKALYNYSLGVKSGECLSWRSPNFTWIENLCWTFHYILELFNHTDVHISSTEDVRLMPKKIRETFQKSTHPTPHTWLILWQSRYIISKLYFP